MRRILVEDRRHRLRCRVTGKRATTRQELVEDSAKRKQIRAGLHGQSTHLFRRHVADGAEHDTRLRRRRRRGERTRCRGLVLRQLRQAEVENLDPVVSGDEDVLGLEIAVRDPFLVRRREAVRDGERQLNRFANRDRGRIHPFPKGLAFEQLRHDERRTGIGADVVHGEDVRVVQRRSRARFLFEPMQAIDVCRECGGQYLDRYVTAQPRIPCAVHLAHAACADCAHDLVRPEASARLQRQWNDQ